MWKWPWCAWSCMHMNYAGPYEGVTFLILVDTYSKWMEVVPVCHATSQLTIEKLWIICATHGLPEMLALDNGNAFTSAEFEEFTSWNSIYHVLSLTKRAE